MFGARPDGGHRQSVRRRGQRDRAALPVHPRGPPGGQRHEQRAHRWRGEQQPDRPRRVQRHREEREDRGGHAEDHGHHVHRVRAQQVLAPPRVGESLADRTQPGDGVLGRRGDMGDPDQQQQRDRVRAGVERVGHPGVSERQQQSGEGGSADGTGLVADRAERGCSGQLVGGDDVGDHRVQRGALQRVGDGEQAGHREQHPHLRVRQQRVDQQHAGQQQHRHLAGHQHVLAVPGVGERAAPEAEHDHRHQLGDAEQPGQRERPGQLLDLERQGDVGGDAAEVRDQARGPDQPEVAGLAQRPGVHPPRARRTRLVGVQRPHGIGHGRSVCPAPGARQDGVRAACREPGPVADRGGGGHGARRARGRDRLVLAPRRPRRRTRRRHQEPGRLPDRRAASGPGRRQRRGEPRRRPRRAAGAGAGRPGDRPRDGARGARPAARPAGPARRPRGGLADRRRTRVVAGVGRAAPPGRGPDLAATVDGVGPGHVRRRRAGPAGCRQRPGR